MKKSRFLLLFAFALFVFLPVGVNAMEILVQTPKGDISLEVESSDTIEAVKEKIFNKNNDYLINNQKLYYDDKELIDGRTLGDYEGIGAGSTIKLEIVEDVPVKVIFNANGGIFVDNEEEYSVEDFYGTSEEVPYPTREGYVFKGYYTEKTGGTKSELILAESGINNNMTFYAQWEKISGIIPSDPGEENPKTFDGIGSSIFIGTISLMGLVGSTIYLKKKNKVGA